VNYGFHTRLFGILRYAPAQSVFEEAIGFGGTNYAGNSVRTQNPVEHSVFIRQSRPNVHAEEVEIYTNTMRQMYRGVFSQETIEELDRREEEKRILIGVIT
jgi:hypothetical protein